MIQQRKFEERDPRIKDVVARRLAKSNNRKGFGNARAVRKKLEEAIKNAVNRDDFDDNLLEISDVIGENPLENPKIDKVKNEIENKIGWKSIKKTVNELIKLCSEN